MAPSEETRRRMSQSHIGHKASEETKQKIRLSKLGSRNPQFGKPLSNEHKRKLSEKLKGSVGFWKGKKKGPLSEECREKIRLANIGRVVSDETKSKIRAAKLGRPNPSIRGERHCRWRGGVTTENHKIRNSCEMKIWREAVFERDKYTCVWCGQIGGKLNADHIKRFCDYPELRFAIDNGRTLCKSCHEKTDNYGARGWKKLKVK